MDTEKLAWEDRPLRELAHIAWPIAVSMLSYSTMTLVDTFFVSRLGAAALAGVGLSGVTVWALICFSLGVVRGAKILVSQAIGAKKPHEIAKITGCVMAYAVSLGLATVAIGQLVALWMPLLAASTAAGTAAESYLRVRIIGTPIVVCFWALREVHQAQSDSRTPMYASIAANIANVAIDYLFVVVLKLGVPGVAWASVIASAVEFAVLFLLVRTTTAPLGSAFTWRHLRAMWWVGWPSGIEMLIEMGAFTMLTILVSRYSELHMAAHQITLQVLHFAFLPAFALGEAASVLTGQATGARRFDLVRPVAKNTLVAAAIYTGACSVVFGVGGSTIARLFSNSASLIHLSQRLFWISAGFIVFDAAMMVAKGALRGTGDVRYPTIVGACTAWALTPPSMWLLGYWLNLGVLGGWMGLFLQCVVLAVLFWQRLLGMRWQRSAEIARRVSDADAMKTVPSG